MFVIFLSVGHYKFVNLHRIVSSRKKNSIFFCPVDTVQCLTDIHEFIVSHRQKYDEQYFSDQTMNEECPIDKCHDI
jgi:hypothetical protein